MKKILALVLALVLVLSLAACGGNTAQTGGSTGNPSTPNTGSNPDDKNEPAKPVGGDWVDANSLPNSGIWRLVTDVTVSAGVTVNDELELDLNGHTILRNVAADEAAPGLFDVAAGAKLTIKDTAAEPTGAVNVAYAAGAKCKAAAALINGSVASEIVLDGGTYDVSGVESTYTTIGGAIYTDGKLTIYKGTIKGYKNVADGKGTVIGAGLDAQIVIHDGIFVGGGTTNNGGVIASKGDLEIKGGNFSVASTVASKSIKNGGLIYMDQSGANELIISGGNFAGVNVATNGGCISAGCPVTISGGEFEAGEAAQGGVIYAEGELTITGGNFVGQGLKTPYKGSGGLVTAKGKKLTITGGSFVKGSANGYGTNVYYTCNKGEFVLGGNANINGGLTIRAAEGNNLKLIVKDKAIVDNTNAVPKAPWNLRLVNVDVYINDGTTAAATAPNKNTDMNLIHDANGNVTGIVNK